MKKLFYSLILVLMLVVTGCAGEIQQNVQTKKKEIPLIPHKINNTMVCAECHKAGKNKAKITKHPDRPNCTQCHKPVK